MKNKSAFLFCIFFTQANFARTVSNSLSQSSVDSKKNVLEERYSRCRLNTMLGINIAQGSGVLSGMQFGYAPLTQLPFYLGPEFTFVLYSPGSLFSVAGGGWYDFKIYNSPRLVLSIGAVFGSGFTNSLPQFPNRLFLSFLDISLSEELDDLASVRVQFRPGIVNKSVAYTMSFSLSFRFQ